MKTNNRASAPDNHSIELPPEQIVSGEMSAVKACRLSLAVALKMENEMLAKMKELEDEFGAELAAELLELFLSDTGQRISSLPHLIERHDIKALSAEAHSMKGSCGNIGAERMVNLCRQLEQCLTLEADPKFVVDRLRSVSSELEHEFLLIKSAFDADKTLAA